MILITIDTLRPDHLGCYGYRRIQTPHLDGLAREGVLFTNAFTPVPVTLPSHASIFTGTYPAYHGVRDFYRFVLEERHTTLAELLKAQGYATGAFVGGAVLQAKFGLAQGFDYYYDRFQASDEPGFRLDRVQRRADEVVDEALAWIREQNGNKFFAWLHLFDPHHPYEPPEPYRSRYQGRPYDGEIAYTDAAVGRFLQGLRDQGLYQSSHVALLGDHGEGLGEHQEQTHGFFIYDSTLRIPLILRLAGSGAPRGKKVDGLVRSIDVMPTLLQALGLPIPDEVQGRGLLASVLGKASPALDLYCETYLPRLHFNWSELRGYRTGMHKFIEAPKPELYHVARDREETRNVWASERALTNQLRQRLREGFQRYAGTASQAGEVDQETLERLQSLGYVALSPGVDLGESGTSLPDPKDRIHVYELIQSSLLDSEAGRLDAAIRKLEQARQMAPDTLAASYFLGLNRFKQGDLEGAKAQFEHVIQINPDFALAHYYLASIHLAAHRMEEAEEAFRQTLKLDAKNYRAHFNLGALYVRRGMTAHALEAFQKAVEVNSGYFLAHNALGKLYEFRGQLHRAIASYEKAVELSPSYEEARKNLAGAYLKAGRRDLAEKILKQ
ncbi:MAG: sulfatase-like hydrolase/transferase [Acidobacteria bacterium]|nr:sulfatase-like hydrolase/transferase [Acidobacteriota bacterium]